MADPWITLSVLGAATSRIRLATNIYLAGLRDPFTVARAVSTASVFTGGRVVCGISAGWLKEEFDAAGIDFASRGRAPGRDHRHFAQAVDRRGDRPSRRIFRFRQGDHAPRPAGRGAGVERRRLQASRCAAPPPMTAGWASRCRPRRMPRSSAHGRPAPRDGAAGRGLRRLRLARRSARRCRRGRAVRRGRQRHDGDPWMAAPGTWPAMSTRAPTCRSFR